MTTQRDAFQASCYEALSRYKLDVAAGVWHVTADNRLVDAILKAWERSLRERAAYAQRGVPRSPQEAAERIRASAS